MIALTPLRAVRCLIRDTFRQTVTSGVSWLMLGLTAACVVGCLFVPLDGPGAVRTLEQQLAGWAGHVAGVLLALVLTGGLLPAFLDPHAASVLLAKPLSRGGLLAGKCLGVLVFVAMQTSLFVGGTWLALAARSGVWDPAYLLCAPLLVLHFLVFFSFSAMLAVTTRSTPACVFGTVLFWLLCWGMNFGRHAALNTLDPHTVSPAFAYVVEAGYWLLPKPLDFQMALVQSLQGDAFFTQVVDVHRLTERGAWSPGWSLAASALWGLGLLAVAAYDFGTIEY